MDFAGFMRIYAYILKPNVQNSTPLTKILWKAGLMQYCSEVKRSLSLDCVKRLRFKLGQKQKFLKFSRTILKEQRNRREGKECGERHKRHANNYYSRPDQQSSGDVA